MKSNQLANACSYGAIALAILFFVFNFNYVIWLVAGLLDFRKADIMRSLGVLIAMQVPRSAALLALPALALAFVGLFGPESGGKGQAMRSWLGFSIASVGLVLGLVLPLLAQFGFLR